MSDPGIKPGEIRKKKDKSKEVVLEETPTEKRIENFFNLRAKENKAANCVTIPAVSEDGISVFPTCPPSFNICPSLLSLSEDGGSVEQCLTDIESDGSDLERGVSSPQVNAGVSNVGSHIQAHPPPLEQSFIADSHIPDPFNIINNTMIKDAQNETFFCKNMVHFLRNKCYQGCSPSKSIAKVAHKYRAERHGLLKFNISSEGQEPVYVPYIPQTLKTNVLYAYHDHPASGHVAFEKTYESIRSRFFWPGMRSDCQTYCDCCAVCQLTRYPTDKPYGRLKHQDLEGNLQHLFADVVGPLPMCNYTEFRYILTCFDGFSKHTVFLPLQKATAKTLAALFERVIIAIYGAPKLLTIDIGTYFNSKIFKSMCRKYGITIRFAAPAQHSANLSENRIRELRQMLKTYCSQHILRTGLRDISIWDRYLTSLCNAVNSYVSSTTKMSANMALFGNKYHNTFDNILYDSGYDGRDGLSDDDTHKLRDIIHDLIKANIEQSNSLAEKHFNARHKVPDFKVGQLVKIRNQAQADAAQRYTPKLDAFWCGPYRLAGFQSESILLLQPMDKILREPIRSHVENTAHYKSPPEKGSVVNSFENQPLDTDLASLLNSEPGVRFRKLPPSVQQIVRPGKAIPPVEPLPLTQLPPPNLPLNDLSSGPISVSSFHDTRNSTVTCEQHLSQTSSSVPPMPVIPDIRPRRSKRIKQQTRGYQAAAYADHESDADLSNISSDGHIGMHSSFTRDCSFLSHQPM